MKLLEIKNMKKSFEDKSVLKGIDFEVSEGEVVTVLGSSGAGKTTLMRCASFLEKMDYGTITVVGNEVTDNAPDEKTVYKNNVDEKDVKNNIGYVFQHFNLFPHYTVMKNLCDAPLVVAKRDAKEVEEEAKSILRKLGIIEKMDCYPCELSGGQQQRVAIARALMMHPRIMFFDEPTSALDPEITRDVTTIIRDLANDGYGNVIVTHDIEFARNVSDRIVFLSDGVVLEEGTCDEVLNNSSNEKVRAFLKSE